MSVNQTVENVYLRQDAVQLTRRHFWRLLGMLLVLTILPSCLERLMTELGDLLMVPETTALLTAAGQYMTSTTLTSAAPVTEAAIDLFTSPKFLLWNLVYGVVTGVVSAGLLMGQTSGLIIAGRGGVPMVSSVFGRMRYCLKAWALELWSIVKITLWLLPGIGVMFLGGALISLEGIGDLLILAGMILMLCLGIQAFFRYWLAPYIMADEPERGVLECITLSKSLMKGHKWQCFRLTVPLALKIIGLMWLVMTVGSLVLDATGLAESVAAYELLAIAAYIPAVYFFLQVDMVQALFYLKRRIPAADAPVSYWLREHTATDIEDESPNSPADAMETQPEDISPETNEKKENHYEQPDC